MGNSSLVNYTKLSPHHSGKRKSKIDKITIHHMAGNLTVERCGAVFQSREASSNYGVGTDGRVGMYVEEANRSWASSSPENDHRAVTIEVANDGGAPDWHVSDTALEKTIELCVDICKRNGIKKLNFTGDKSGNLTMHKYFTSTTCPGPYLGSKFPYIAAEVNKRLSADTAETTETAEAATVYRVQVGAFRSKENAETQRKKLAAAGFDAIISTQGNTATTEKKKTVQQLAAEVVAGLWGNGAERIKRLTAAGYNAAEVQAEVNKRY